MRTHPKAKQTKGQLCLRWAIGLTLMVLGGWSLWLTIAVCEQAARPTRDEGVPLVINLMALGSIALTIFLFGMGVRTVLRRGPLSQPAPSDARDVHRFYSVTLLILAAVWAAADPLQAILGFPPVLRWAGSFLCYATLCYGFAWFSIFAHEAAHALVAAGVRQRPVEICIGYGRVISRWKLGQVEFVNRIHPFSGYAAVDEVRSWTRMEIASFALAGPIASFLLGCGVLWLIAAFPQLIPSYLSKMMWLSLFWSAAMSLVPTKVEVAAGVLPSDGDLLMAAMFPLRGQ